MDSASVRRRPQRALRSHARRRPPLAACRQPPLAAPLGLHRLPHTRARSSHRRWALPTPPLDRLKPPSVPSRCQASEWFSHSSPLHSDACTQPRLAAEGLCASLVVLNTAASARRGRARRWGQLEAKASMWERADVVWVTAAATATAGAAVFHTALSIPARRVSPAQGHGAHSHEALVTHSRQGSAQPHCPGRAAGQSPGASRPWPLAVAAAAPAAAAGAAAGSRPSNERHGERRQGNCHRRR